VCPSELDREVPALAIAEVTQRSPKDLDIGVEGQSGPHDPEPPHLSRRLGHGVERRGKEAQRATEEHAPVHDAILTLRAPSTFILSIGQEFA
jgi:hypothetical protein